MVDAVRMNLCILDATIEVALLQFRVVSERIAAKVEVADAREDKCGVLVGNSCCLSVRVLVDNQGTRVAGPVTWKSERS